MVSVLFFVFIVTMLEIKDTVKLTESEDHYSEIQKSISGRQDEILRIIEFNFFVLSIWAEYDICAQETPTLHFRYGAVKRIEQVKPNASFEV